MKVLIVCSGNAPNFNFEIHQAFIFDQVQAIAKKYPDITFEYFFICGHGIRGYLKNLNKLIKIIKESHVDIIHAHFALSGLLCVLQRRVPVITTFHGSDINNRNLRILSLFVEILSRKTIYVSHRLKELALYSSKNHAYIIPCGIDLNLFKPVDSSLAREEMGLDPHKIHILFSSSFGNAVKNYSLLRHALETMNNCEIVVHELKNFTREQVVFLMNAADLCVMTSFSEGSPQFIKEAMACNCPIIATDVGDIHEVIGDTNGCYITSFDPVDLASKIKLALNFNKRTNGRDKIKNFDNGIIAEKIFKIYKSSLQKH